jgi:hypothetical protein
MASEQVFDPAGKRGADRGPWAIAAVQTGNQFTREL